MNWVCNRYPLVWYLRTVSKNASGIVLFSVQLTNEVLFGSVTANFDILKFQ